jgi:phosphate transport system permease protein
VRGRKVMEYQNVENKVQVNTEGLKFKSEFNLKQLVERIVEKVFVLSSLVSILSIFAIGVFIFYKGFPAILKVGAIDFLTGTKWMPSADIYGILPMIVGSLLGTFGAILLGVPIGVFTAIFLAEFAPKNIYNLIKPAVELLAGIPSVVYGFFGLIVIVPMIDSKFGGGGNSLLAVIIILGVMILPTVINITENAIRSVPRDYKEASIAMGVSHIQTIFKVILPAAKSGILAAVVLGVGRAVGETMAVILVAGNTPMIPGSIFHRIRTLTANIAIEMGYASGLHQDILFSTGVILFVFIMILNIILNYYSRKVEM